MRLIELEIENIKSYVHETINFNDGINCILGKNGGGKSTVIECIGYALFNYSPMQVNDMIRYNEKSGKISIKFLANDGFTYKIVRKLKAGQAGSVKIIRDSDNEVLQENVSNVYSFVNKVLKINGEKTLAKLFEEIVAVPQGTFVNAFLEAPAKRKDNFDKLFQLDVYKKVSEEVKKLSDKVKTDYIDTLTNEISLHEGLLKKYDETVNEFNNLKEAVKKNEETLTEETEIYNKKVNEKKALEDKEKEYNELKNKINLENQNNNNLIEGIKNQEKEILKIKESKQIVLDNEFGYNSYEKNNEDLQKNQIIQDRVNELNSILTNNNTKIEGNKTQIDSLRENNNELKYKRGTNIDTINKNKTEINRMIKENEEYNKELKPLIETNNKLKDDTQKAHSNIAVIQSKLNNALNSFINYDKNQDEEQFENKINEIKVTLETIKDKKQQQHDLEIEKAELSRDLQNLQNNEKDMRDGLCPILKQKCKNIESGSLTTTLSSLIDDKLSRIKEVTTLLEEMKPLIDKEEGLNKDLNTLELSKNNLKIEKERYNNIINEIKEALKEEASDITLDNATTRLKELLDIYTDLKDNFENKELKESLAREEQLKSNISTNSLQSKFLDGSNKNLEKDNEDFTEKIRLNDDNITKLSGQNIDLEQKNNNIILELNLKGNVEIEIQNNKQALEKFKASHDLYLANLNLANSLEENEDKLKDLNKQQEKSTGLIVDYGIKLNELKEQFNHEELVKLVDEINELYTNITSLKATNKVQNDRINKLDEEIKDLNKTKEEKEKLEQEKDKYIKLNEKYELYRKVYKNLPEELSSRIRKYISTYATHIYREISKENVTIEILSDYEVEIKDCSDVNKVKHLHQLSGGEQMSVAISIRLAMLKNITNIDIYFMDEPTVNLDEDRRKMVAEVVKDVSSSLTQLFVISHDDTFQNITNSVIKIEKEGNISRLI